LEESGQFRFTPPTHVIKAFWQALQEFNEQGGINMKYKKYNENQKLMMKKLSDLGFKLYIDPKYQGCIVTTFLQPIHPNFEFKGNLFF
jgi:2-aminoethylphosphonate-pyruvate transaminase